MPPMTKKKWQDHHGFDDADMAKISDIVHVFDGIIVAINERCIGVCVLQVLRGDAWRDK